MANPDPHRTPPIAPHRPEQTSGEPARFDQPTTLPTSEEVAADPPEYDRVQMQDELDGLKKTLDDLRGQLGRAYDEAAVLARENSKVLIGAAAVGGVIAAGLLANAISNRPSRRRRKIKRFQREFERSAHVLADAIAERVGQASAVVSEEASRLGSAAQGKAEVFAERASDRASEFASEARDVTSRAARQSRHAAADGWDRLEQAVRPLLAAAVVDRATDWLKKVRS